MFLIFRVLLEVIFIAIGEILLFGTLFFGVEAVLGYVFTYHSAFIPLLIGFGGGSLDDGVWVTGTGTATRLKGGVAEDELSVKLRDVGQMIMNSLL